MKASEQQALIPQEATPDTLIDLIGKTQQVTKAAAVGAQGMPQRHGHQKQAGAHR